MKIAEFETYIMGNPLPHRGGLDWVFVKLVTDEGIEGWGECNFARYREYTLVQLVKELGKRFVVGQDPFNIERIWEGLYKSTKAHTSHIFQHPGGLTGQAFGGLEMACWDIAGKVLNRPVYQLLGGKRNEKLRAYTYLYDWGQGDPPEEAGPVATRLVEQGFTLFKLDLLPPLRSTT